MDQKTKTILDALESLPTTTFEEQDEVLTALARALRVYVARREGNAEEIWAFLAREFMK